MKKAEQKLRALVQYRVNAGNAELSDIEEVLADLSETRRRLSQVKALLDKKDLETLENDEAYDTIVDLMNLFEEELT